jgi:hypothetical protein
VNRYQALIAGAWTLAVVAGVASTWAWSTAVPAVPREPRKAYPAVPIPPPDTAGLAQAAAALRDRDPFRFERKPTKVRFNPWEPTGVTAAAPRAPARPTLGLVGVLGGPPWNALLKGVPGREAGVVLGVGESVNGIKLTRMHGDTAFVSGFDTTWVLIPGRVMR